MHIRGLCAASLALLAVLSAFPSCVEEEEAAKPFITVTCPSGDAVLFEAVPNGAQTILIESNESWKITKDDLDWCTVSPRVGFGGSITISIRAAINENLVAREGSITITAASLVKTLTVSQAAGSTDPFVVSGTEGGKIVLPADSEAPVSFTVYGGTAWTAAAEALEWCRVMPLNGGRKQSATITLIPQINLEEAVRCGNILFKDEAGAELARVEVSQEAFEAKMTVTPEALNASASGQLEVNKLTVTANAGWTAGSESGWIHVDPSTGEAGETEVTVTVDGQTETEDRSADLVFQCRSLSVPVTVTQAGRIEDRMEVDVERIDFPARGSQPQVVNVTSNTIWSVSTDASWLTVEPLSGNGDGRFTVTVQDNEGPESFEGVITVSAGTVTRTIPVTQERGVDPSKFIDLMSEPLLWTVGQETVDWDQHGILYPDTHADLARAEWTWNNGPEPLDYVDASGNPYPVFSVAKDRNRVRCVWLDDAMVFTVPVVNIPAGKTLVFLFGFRGGSWLPACWTAEACLDGTTWKKMDIVGGRDDGQTTNVECTDRDGNTFVTPMFLFKKDSDFPFEASTIVPETLSYKEIKVRFRVYDVLAINGKYNAVNPTDNTNSNCMIMLGTFEFEGIKYVGPRIYIR